jgi:lysophospholipase L1-like esterase
MKHSTRFSKLQQWLKKGIELLSSRKTRTSLLVLGTPLLVLLGSAALERVKSPEAPQVSILRVVPPKRSLKTPAFHRKQVNLAHNRILSPDPHAMKTFYRALDSLASGLRQQVNIVHLGDSHIQADVFPGKVRYHLQKDSLLGNAGRGLVFPHSLLRSNNGMYIRCSHTGIWAGCKNAELNKYRNWGLTGVVATTFDQHATVTLNPNTTPDLPYLITRVKVFYPVNDPTSFVPKILSQETAVAAQRIDEKGGYIEFTLSFSVPAVTLGLSREQPQQNNFSLQGISLEQDTPGIQYHSLGINGVSTTGFLRSPQLEQHLAALKADLVIISLGTNDAYVRRFDHLTFKRNLGTLIQRIKRALPKASLLLTTPGDNLLYRRYTNHNNSLACQTIQQLAEEAGCAAWDLFGVMGGLNSINQWHANGLAMPDKLHFSTAGYSLQGDLLYDALMQDYACYGQQFPFEKIQLTGR